MIPSATAGRQATEDHLAARRHRAEAERGGFRASPTPNLGASSAWQERGGKVLCGGAEGLGDGAGRGGHALRERQGHYREQ